MFYFKLWRTLIKAEFKSITTYKLDFFFGATSLIFLDLPILVLIWVIFNYIPTFYTWTFYEMLLLSGILMTISNLSDFFEGHIRNLGELLVNGNFDNYLIRPVKTPFLIIFSSVQLEAIVSFIFSLTITGYAVIHISELHSVLNFFILFIHVIIGSYLTSAIIFFLSCLSFWFMGVRRLYSIISFSQEYSSYPLSIYPKVIQIIIKWIIPVGFVGPYAIKVLTLGNAVSSIKVLSIEIGMCLVWTILDVCIWKKGIKIYQSSGS